MINLPWMGRFVLLRLVAQWRSLVTVIVGVLLAGIIGANAPLYTATVAQIGMVERLEDQPQERVNVFSRFTVTGSQLPDIASHWSTFDRDVRAMTDDSFAAWQGWVSEVVTWGETSSMIPMRDGIDLENIKLRVGYFEGWTDQVSVIDGALPDSTDATIQSTAIDSAISVDLAALHGLSVGDVITLDQRGWETSQLVQMRISAIIAPIDPTSAYWMSPSPLRMDGGSNPETTILTTRDNLIRVGQLSIPDTRTQLGWRVLFNPARLPYSDIPMAITQLNAFQTRLTELTESNDLTLVFNTQLPTVLQDYSLEVTLLAAPFGLLLLQIGALVMFFLVVIVALVRRGERREVAMLQSRGAFDYQIVMMRGVEALVICAAVTLIAPILTRQLLILFAPLFSNVESLPLTLDATPFLYAAGASALALIVLITTLRPVLRMPLILAGGSAMRSEKTSWWQRSYLDVVLLVVGSAALLRLLNTDSPFAETLVGDLQADPLLLIAPALLFVALGSISLRLFPALAEVSARFFAGRRGLGGALAMWQVSREPAHYGRITFLLALAIGVGWFATSFQATISRSQRDQSEYRVGADVRLIERDTLRNVDRPQPESVYTALPEVAAASNVYRGNGVNFSQSNFAITDGQILGVDPESFAQTAYWRPDLGALVLPPTVEIPEIGAALPADADIERIGLWVKLDHIGEIIEDGIPTQVFNPDVGIATNATHYFARLIDANGAYITVPLIPMVAEGIEEVTDLSQLVPHVGIRTTAEEWQAELGRVAVLSEGATGWVYVEGNIPIPGAVRFDSIYWRTHEEFARFTGINRLSADPDWRLTLADLTLIDDAGNVTPFDILRGDGLEWAFINDWDQGAYGTTTRSFERENGRVISWVQSVDRTTMGIILNAPLLESIPAVFSRRYAEENNLLVGATVELFLERQRLYFEIVGLTDYFPSLYGEQAPFAIANRDALLYTLSRRPGAGSTAHESWIKLNPDVSSAAFMSAFTPTLQADQRVLRSSITIEGTLDRLQTDSLALGLIGLLFIAFAVALLLSVVSLLTYMALTAQGRRGEFAVLRALGFPVSRLVTSIALEQALVFITSIGLGAILGLMLSHQVLPTMATSTTGETITPPFLVQVEIGALLQYGLILLIVLSLVLLGSVWLVRRLSLSQTLRYGEE